MELNFDEIKDGYIATLKKFSDFNGRARRREFWMFAACNIAVMVVVNLVFGLIPFLGHLASGLASLAVAVVSIAVGVRRMHDTNRPGWMVLIPFANIYWATLEGTSGENPYGPDPKAAVPPAEPPAEEPPAPPAA